MAIIEVNGHSFHMDGYIKEICDNAKAMLRNDWDVMLIVDGVEGVGKSVLAQQIGGYIAKPLDNDEQINDYFVIDDICFTPNEFKKRIEKQKKYRTVIFDEAFRGLSARRSMSDVNNILNVIFNEVRQRNLCIILVMPCFFEMDKYPALWRSTVLFHVKADKMGKRGEVNVYDRSRKTELYIEGKKRYSYKTPQPNFRARFVSEYVIDEGVYRQLKSNAFLGKKTEEFQEKLVQRYQSYLGITIDYLITKGISVPELAKVIGVHPSLLHQFKRKHLEKLGAKVEEDKEEGENTTELKEIQATTLPN